MKKKIMIGSILAVSMLVAISLSAAAVSNQSNTVEKKKTVSPLFGIRTKDAIGEKLSSLRAKFLGERIFLNIKPLIQNIVNKALPSCDNSLSCCTVAWTNCPRCDDPPRTESGFTCGGYLCIK